MERMNLTQNKGALASRVVLLCLALTATAGLFYAALNSANGLSMRSRFDHARPYHTTSKPRANATAIPDGCPRNAEVGSIAYSIKTGATVAMERLPIQLMTAFRCVPDLMVFSDLAQTIGGLQVVDVLDAFSPGAKRGNPDFDLYHKQQEYAAAGREADLSSLAELPIKDHDWRTAGKSAAWGLDKYKFIHMVERAWQMQPDREWYVFLEADTYLSVPTLERWLATLDPMKKLYLGHAIRMWEHPSVLHFAHGGSGIVLSGAAVRDLAVTHQGTANRFDGRIRNWWFGDFILADALDEVCRIKITDVTPSLQPEEPSLIPFGEHLWCKRALTLHHMDARGFDEMYRFEKARNFSELLFRDVYHATLKAKLPFQKQDWDNGSDDDRFALPVVHLEKEKIAGVFNPEALEDPHESLSACEQACIKHAECFQFSFAKGPVKKRSGKTTAEQKCHLSSMFRRGRRQETQSGKTISSGWRSDRIERWVSEHQKCRGD